MRTRIAAPLVVGALAAAAIAVPTAASAATATPVVTKAWMSSNVFGLSGQTTMAVDIEARDTAGVQSITFVPYPLAMVAKYGYPTEADVAKEGAVPATSTTATTEVFKASKTFTLAKGNLPPNAIAGTYGLAVLVVGKDGGKTFLKEAGTFSYRRADVVTAKSNRTTVFKGGLVTFAGKLSRANLDAYAWQGYGSQLVRLQFRKAGTSAWVTEAYARTLATGTYSATVRDYASGSWRVVYGGDALSGAAVSASIGIAA